jgi:hypothetical protein
MTMQSPLKDVSRSALLALLTTLGLAAAAVPAAAQDTSRQSTPDTTRTTTPAPHRAATADPGRAAAGDAHRIRPGDRLRVRVPTASLLDVVARAGALPGDSLRLHFDPQRHATLPAASLQRVELARGRLSRGAGALRSGGGGAWLGLMVGGVAAVVLWDEGDGTGGERWAEAARTTAAGVGAGAILGSAWGLIAPGPRWLRFEGDAIPATLGLAAPPPAPRLVTGDSVSVRAAGPRLQVGRLLTADGDSLELARGDGTVSRVPLADVRAVAVHRGRGDRGSAMWAGASGGTTAAGLIGVGTGLVAYFVASSADHPRPWRPALATVVGTGVLGATAGAVVGARDRADIWELVPIGEGPDQRANRMSRRSGLP